MCNVVRGVSNLSIPLVGCPAFLFIDQRRAGVIDGKKKKNQRPRRSFEGVGSSFSSEPAPLTWQTVPRIARSLILIGPCSGFVHNWSRPIPPHRVARRTRVPSHDPTGSRRGSDHMSVTVDDVSSLLDCSGCRMLMLGSTPEG